MNATHFSRMVVRMILPVVAGVCCFTASAVSFSAGDYYFDNSKLKRAVPGFQATVRFEEGVRRTIENILAHPELQKPDPAFDAWCDRVIEALEQAKASLR